MKRISTATERSEMDEHFNFIFESNGRRFTQMGEMNL